MKASRQIHNSAETNGYEITLVNLNWCLKFCKTPFGLQSRSQLHRIQCTKLQNALQLNTGWHWWLLCCNVRLLCSAHKPGRLCDSSSLDTFKQYEDLTEVKAVVLNIKQSYPGLTKYYVMVMQMRLLGDRWTGWLKSSEVLLKVYIRYLWHCMREYCMNFRTVQMCH